MKIKKILDKDRRDFWADYECEHCGNVEYNKRGYDNAHFHVNLIPKMVCAKCGKTSPTKYPEWVQI